MLMDSQSKLMALKLNSQKLLEAISKHNKIHQTHEKLIINLFHRVTIKFNINHTVDQDGEPEISSQEDETVEMKSKPE